MEEIEIPTEHLHESINEKAEESKEKWALYVALSTAFMAVFAAVSGLMAGHHANEAMLEQIKSSNQWAYYQAKSIKAEIVVSTDSIVAKLSGKPAPEVDIQKLERYEKEKEAIKVSAEDGEKKSELHLDIHNILARAVTLFQIAIAMAAIAILTRKKFLWVISILMAAAGIIFLLQGILFK
jgi:aspartyl/asparaginyl-tRNA synthetase